MPNGKMDPIQVEDAIVGEQWTLSPGLKLLGQRLVEAAHGAGAGCHSHQGLGDFPDFMGACPTDKPLRQGFRYLGFIAAIALKHGAIWNCPSRSRGTERSSMRPVLVTRSRV